MLSKCWEEVDHAARGGRGGGGCRKPGPSATACSYLGTALPWLLRPTGSGWAGCDPSPRPGCWCRGVLGPPFPEEGRSRAGGRSRRILLTPAIPVLLVLGHGGPGTGGSEAPSPRSLCSWAPGCWQWEALCPAGLGAGRSGSGCCCGAGGKEKGGENG